MANGTTYVYECEDEYRPEYKQTRKKYRKLIGKLDENGEIIPTRKKAQNQSSVDVTQKESDDQIIQKMEKNTESLTQMVDKLSRELKDTQAKAEKYEKLLDKIQKDISAVL